MLEDRLAFTMAAVANCFHVLPGKNVFVLFTCAYLAPKAIFSKYIAMNISYIEVIQERVLWSNKFNKVNYITCFSVFRESFHSTLF